MGESESRNVPWSGLPRKSQEQVPQVLRALHIPGEDTEVLAPQTTAPLLPCSPILCDPELKQSVLSPALFEELVKKYGFSQSIESAI